MKLREFRKLMHGMNPDAEVVAKCAGDLRTLRRGWGHVDISVVERNAVNREGGTVAVVEIEFRFSPSPNGDEV